ncbi:MAG TPA: tRNA lysidine(34) synthetase TilS [Methylomirabilota bacterium]|nr:tRNA lysidine(34) synthetase TilS [Methylomirabilota bacterium]
MQVLGPFEARPRLGVAVSGGSDSMALALLAAGWAQSHGATITALTVDHGLRREAAAEARRVGRWLGERGIRHRILRWRPDAGAPFAGGVQAAARAARYRLLADWCRRHGVLHLALAHHQEDQAETFLLRLARGSGLAGLAAMAPVTERDGVRLLRPLLLVPRARLRATLAAAGQAWIDDPSNANRAHARVRMRALIPSLAAEGLDAARLAATAGRLGRARAAIDDAVADLLAAASAIFPAGYLSLDPAALAAAAAEVSLRALARCLTTIGGAGYGPRLERLERLHAAIRGSALASAATLGGCRIVPRRGRLLICREPAAAREAIAVRSGETVSWDGRFVVTVAPVNRGARPRSLTVKLLGAAGWAAVAADNPDLRKHALPPPVRPGLPALWDGARVACVPHLDYCRTGVKVRVSAVFAPEVPLAPTRFATA